jgi:hypothetical protein
MLRVEPHLKSQRFLTILTFEASSDRIFISGVADEGAPQAAVRQDDAHAHTGSRSLRVDAPAGGLSVKLSSLLGTGTFPGEWKLAGAYFLSRDGVAEVAASCRIDQVVVARNVVKLTSATWCPVYIDLTDLPEAAAAAAASGTARATLEFQVIARGPVWMDDVTLVDNTQTVLDADPAAGADGAWAIRRSGLRYIGDLPGHRRFTLPTDLESSDGWTVAEAYPIRARFTSGGSIKHLTIYPDGRALWDGQYRPLGEARSHQALADAHTSPAQIHVEPSQGRVDRTTAGDANNDGYNEMRGAYPLIASAGRVEVTLVPRSAVLINPVLEISGLPPGALLVNVEGRLIERSVRLEDDTVLVEIPGKIQRPTVAYISVQPQPRPPESVR